MNASQWLFLCVYVLVLVAINAVAIAYGTGHLVWVP